MPSVFRRLWRRQPEPKPLEIDWDAVSPRGASLVDLLPSEEIRPARKPDAVLLHYRCESLCFGPSFATLRCNDLEDARAWVPKMRRNHLTGSNGWPMTILRVYLKEQHR